MESENTWSLRIPGEMLKLRASRRASPSATNGDPTKWQCANFDVCWSLSSIVHPSPANFRSPLQAASDLNVAVSGCLAGVLCVPDFGGAESRVFTENGEEPISQSGNYSGARIKHKHVCFLTKVQHCLARDVVNIIACEGADRVERHELLGKWRSRFGMAGFTPYPLSPLVNSTIKTLLRNYSDKYRLEERDGALYILVG
ncbi:hypothetical protein DY000_02011105 [Brassica cretica]|uniref:Uncharacterized protein n=1 Tax=Brassica cretica TaxID=69181 RepID=A0ABQ7DBQ4_BRACR|nr:hypothetical protein DY000_02011105 [Brassica cretica]